MNTPSVAAILLAAGGSTRLGQPKQLLPYCDRSLLRYVAETAQASAVGEVFAVLGFEAERMNSELRGLNVRSIVNPQWEEGVGSSIHAGVSSLSTSIDATLLLLCDQPLITTELLNTVISTHEMSGKAIVACEYGGTIGVPALFARSFFSDLLRLQGDRGAKQLILQHADELATVPFPGGIVDIDTAADYDRFLSSGN